MSYPIDIANIKYSHIHIQFLAVWCVLIATEHTADSTHCDIHCIRNFLALRVASGELRIYKVVNTFFGTDVLLLYFCIYFSSYEMMCTPLYVRFTRRKTTINARNALMAVALLQVHEQSFCCCCCRAPRACALNLPKISLIGFLFPSFGRFRAMCTE